MSKQNANGEALTAEQRILKQFGSKEFWKQARKVFDRSLEITIIPVRESGKDMIKVQLAEHDNGRAYMTTADVAAYLDRDRRTIRRWCETRAQQQTADPIPFFRLYGELRFERAKIDAWQKRHSDAPVILPPIKGKRKNTR